MKITNRYYIAIWLLFPLFIGCASLKSNSESEAERKLTKQIRSRVSRIERPWGSKTSYIPILFEKGTIIESKPMLATDSSFVLPEDGYLVFFDEKPKYDWTHPSKFIFVPKDPKAPPIIFATGSPPGWYNIIDNSGKKVSWYTSISF